ncbi:MAG TPA: FHA domain-containing protein [Kouleothrix sp.]|uniref:FHA domain-containing protein n=1 Tax=Kouleothrix sp. TaxID=2779161 RepID=UPI002BB53FC4|nr:FHA domain-containing protein [Kouleothrix sp.]HRC74977.1 FHA domain-containing protein [Kouleothrix sp.]
MFGHLHIEERGRPARVVDLLGSATIGRTADNDIVLDSDGVSHCHAMLLAQPSGVLLVDLGSTFGTLIDAVPAPPDEPVRLADGAQISIGRAALRYLAPRVTVPMAPLDPPGSPQPPPLAAAHLNTRFEGFDADTPLLVGRAATLRVWVGAPLSTDEHQSSRPLKVSSAHLASQLALRVMVRAASPSWHIRAEQPTLLAARWGTVQIARYTLVAARPERTRLAVRVEHTERHTLLQHLTLGVMASDAERLEVRARSPRARVLDDVPPGQLPICRQCYAPVRTSARFCPNCGARL